MKRPRLWPDTLFMRMFLLIAGLLVLSQIAVYWFFNIYQLNPRAEMLARQWAQTLTIVAALQPAQVDALRDRLQQEGMSLSPTAAIQGHSPKAALLHATLVRMRQLLSPQAELLVDYPHGRIWLRLSPASPLAVGVALPAPAALPLPWLKLAAIVLLSLLGAFLTVRQVARPLTRLMNSVESMGREDPPPTVPETGPADVRRLATRFNQLLRDLYQLWKERELVLVGVSHDLRTPLTRLRLAAEFLPSDSEARGEIVANVREMDGVIAQFLDYARSGREEELEPGDLAQLLQELVERYHDQTELILHLPREPLPTVAFQPIGLARAVQNLMENAMRHGAGPIDIRAERRPGAILVTVRDHGSGIPEAILPRIRAPFAQAGQGGGIGLGLAIVERIISRHGGHLSLRNTPDGGLEATLDLPCPRP
ncbi:ATP-binding protein [Acidithiobacillus sulfuriphilus]|uniref:histidine kinase n=2 Tax=Acidithiobacillus sulfuriphilus TaxID=1867749 RepID=A0A3M8R823_9PROT|nr:ATP-binding protein [Acidithiobacillus sulfuriphilus]RNF64281.1 HAMP domain-containing protein [Acidithiobacillus sulfuriphilus]